MRKLKPISRILFERQTAVFEGKTIKCYNLFECLLFIAAALGFFGALAILATIFVFMREMSH